MKRREFIKYLGGGSLALTFPALSEPIKGACVTKAWADETVPTTLADIKNAIGCLEKNKCQPIQPMNEFFFYASEDVYEDVAKKVETYNQNYLKLRNSRW